MYACTPTFAQQYIQKQESQIINLLANAGFESGKANWPQSTPSTVTVVSGTSALFGGGSVKFEATSGTQTFSSGLYTVPAGLKGKECHAVVNYSTNDTTSIPYIAKVIDASGTVLSTKNLNAKIVSGVPTTLPTSVTVDGWNCPTDKQIKLDVVPTAVGPWVVLDNMHLGSKTGGLGNAADIVNALGYTPVASVSGTAPITITGGASNPVVGHADSGVTSGTYTKVAVNSKGHVTSGTTLSESDIPNLDASKITTGILPSDRGGTSFGTYATGDLLVGSGTTLGKLPIGTSNQVLTVSGGAIVWSTNTAATVLNSVLTTTVSTTLTLSNDMVFVTPGTTTVTITLPSATSGTGKIITVQKTDIGPGSVMITTQGGQTIDGSSSTRLDVKLESAKLISDGLNWSVLNREFLIPITSKYRVSAVKTSSTTQPMDYDTVIFDDLSLVVPGASWNFKAPKAGIYQTCVTFVDPGVGTYMSIYVNGTLVQPLSTVVAASEPSANCNYVKVNKNDLIDARSATTMTLNSTGLGTFNNITITYYR